MYDVAIVFYSVCLCAILTPRTEHSLKYMKVNALTKEQLASLLSTKFLTAVPYTYVKPLAHFSDRRDVKAKYGIQKIHKYLS